MTPHKFGAALVGAALSFLLSAPDALQRVAGVALWFVVVDSITGVLCARSSGAMTSTVFRSKLRDKMLCYFSLLALAAGVGVLATSWAWMVAGFWAVCAAEGLSIAENLRGVLSKAGPQLAPISRLLDRLTGVLKDFDPLPTDQAPQPKV